MKVEVLIEHCSFSHKVNQIHYRLVPCRKRTRFFNFSVTLMCGGGMINFAGGGGLVYVLMRISGGVFLTTQTFFKAKNNNLYILSID